MIRARNIFSVATSIMLGFTLVGCKSSLSAVSSVEESVKAPTADFASTASLTQSPMDDALPPPYQAACKTAKKTNLPMTTADIKVAVFKTPATAMLAPAGVALSHYSRAEDSSNYIAVNKKAFYGNVAFPTSENRISQLSQVILEGSCADYQFGKRTFQNMVVIESKECGRTVSLAINGGVGTVSTGVYFNDGYAYIKYSAYTGNSNQDNRWFQWILRGQSEINLDSTAEIVCEKYDEAAKKRMDTIQFQHFGQYK